MTTRRAVKDIIREAIEDNSTSISEEEIDAAAEAAADKLAEEIDDIYDEAAPVGGEPEEMLETDGDEVEAGV